MVPRFRPARTADAPTASSPLSDVFMAAQTSGPNRSVAASANVAGGAPCPLAQDGLHSTRQQRRTSRAASTACCVHSRACAPPSLQKAVPRQSCQCQLREQAAAATDSRREVRRTAVITTEIACAQARSEDGRRQRRLGTVPCGQQSDGTTTAAVVVAASCSSVCALPVAKRPSAPPTHRREESRQGGSVLVTKK